MWDLRRIWTRIAPATEPDRARWALDVFSDAVLVLDSEGTVTLANRSFRALHPEAVDPVGRHIDSFHWLWAVDTGKAPWARVLEGSDAVPDELITLARPSLPTLQALMSSAPVVDGRGRRSGCLVTFRDVTQILSANADLQTMLSELERSCALVEARNLELQNLATRDPLTGCLNRRALFQQASASLAKGDELCCVMIDVDLFKRFNDQYGHPVGDQIIQSVARTLAHGLRASDLLGRYGGEEFCVFMPNTRLDTATPITERLRHAVLTQAAASTRLASLPAVTASFGVASTSQGPRELLELVKLADAALLRSKREGRNRVTMWQPEVAEADGGRV